MMEEDDDLPMGWVKSFSKRKNRYYYFNTQNGQSQWKKPEYNRPATPPSPTSQSMSRPSEIPEAISSGLTPLVQQAMAPKTYNALLICVLDTNVFLSSTDFVEYLRSFNFMPHGHPLDTLLIHILVPSVVVRELDAMKSSDRILQSQSILNSGNHVRTVGTAARHSMRWLQAQLTSHQNQHVTVQAQASASSEGNNDDSILNCTHQALAGRYNSHIQGRIGPNPIAKVLLISNDRALCVKALSSSIAALPTEQIPLTNDEQFLQLFMSITRQVDPRNSVPSVSFSEVSHENGDESALNMRGLEILDVEMHEPEDTTNHQHGSDEIVPLDSRSDDLSTTDPARAYCICSKLPVLHYAHQEDEEPKAIS